MRTIPIKLLNSLIKIAQRKHKIPKSSSFPKVFFQNFEVDQTQIFEKKPYKNYYFLVSYACVEPFL